MPNPPWRLALAAFLLMGSALPAARAQDSTPPAPPSVRAPSAVVTGEFLDRFATEAGGWFVQERCGVLAGDEKPEFEWNLAQTNLAIAHAGRRDMAMLLQRAAKGVADKVACDGKDTGEIVMGALELSRQTAFAATGRRYSAGERLELERTTIVALFAARRIDETCKAMPREIAAEYAGLLASIGERYGREHGKEEFDDLATKGAAAIPARGVACGPTTKDVLVRAVSEARKMAAG